MANFARGFNRGFNLRPAANTISQFILGKAERERKQGDDEIQNQILQALLRGTVEENPPQLRQQEFGLPDDSLDDLEIPFDVGQRRITRDRPFTREERAGLVGGLSDKSFRRFTRMEKILSPEEKQETFKYDKNSPFVFKEDPITKELIKTDIPNPLFKKRTANYTNIINFKNKVVGYNKDTNETEVIEYFPNDDNPAFVEELIETLTEDFVDASTVPGLKNVKGLTVKRTIIKKGKSRTVKYSKPFEITIKNDDGYKLLSKPVKRVLDNLFMEQQRLKAKVETLKSGLPIFDKKGDIVDPPSTSFFVLDIDFLRYNINESGLDELNEIIASSNREFQFRVKSVMSKVAEKWIDDVLNKSEGKKIAGKYPEPIEYWIDLLTSFRDGNLGDTDKDATANLEILTYFFKATYGNDPNRTYKTNIEELQQIIDEKDAEG